MQPVQIMQEQLHHPSTHTKACTIVRMQHTGALLSHSAKSRHMAFVTHSLPTHLNKTRSINMLASLQETWHSRAALHPLTGTIAARHHKGEPTTIQHRACRAPVLCTASQHCCPLTNRRGRFVTSIGLHQSTSTLCTLLELHNVQRIATPAQIPK